MSASPSGVVRVHRNSARSIMAEALLRHQGGAASVYSAGTEPRGINPLTIRPSSRRSRRVVSRSKSVTGFLGERFDYVITVCDQARQAARSFPASTESFPVGGTRIQPRPKGPRRSGSRSSEGCSSGWASGSRCSSRSRSVGVRSDDRDPAVPAAPRRRRGSNGLAGSRRRAAAVGQGRTAGRPARSLPGRDRLHARCDRHLAEDPRRADGRRHRHHLGVAVTIDDRLAEGVDLRALEDVLRAAGNPARPVLVGHDPDFSDLVETLTASPALTMKKGAMLRIDAERPLEPGGGNLVWLVPPALLKPAG